MNTNTQVRFAACFFALALLAVACGDIPSEGPGIEGTSNTLASGLETSIERLGRDEVLVARYDGEVTTKFAAEIPRPVEAWKCNGNGVGFAKCTQKIVDAGGCAIVVTHEDGYCSKPC